MASRPSAAEPVGASPAGARDWTAAGELALLAALLVFVAGLCLQPITESDLFFRLKVGQEILARGGLLGRNLFSFTAPDHPDLDLAWAFEVGVALLYRAGGFSAVVAGKALWLVAVFAGAFAVCRRRGAGPLASALTLAAAAFVMRERFVERPHVVSFAGEVVILAALARLDRPWSWRRLLAFAVAMVAWANAHAGVFLGVFMLVMASAGAFPTDRGRARRGFGLAVLAAAAACLVPVGPAGLGRYLLLHLHLPDLHPIDEFRSATWRSDAPFFVWAALVVAAVTVGFVGARTARRRAKASRGGRLPLESSAIGPSDATVAVGVLLLGFASVRFSADAALVTAPLLATALSGWLVRVGARLGNRARSVALALAVSGLVFAALFPRWVDARRGGRAVDVGLDASALPLDALRFVEEHGLRERMYNDFEFGSYLLFEGYPRHRVFVDPRLPAYPEDMHRLLGSFDVGRAAWDAAMAKYGVETALLGDAGINRRVAWWDPQTWALVYRAHDARVFVRRREKWRDLVAALEVPATFDFTVEHGATTLPLEDRPAASPVSDCEWQRRLGDLLFELDRGVPTRARDHYLRALSVPGCLPPVEEARLAAWMGALDLGRGELAPALGHLERALSLQPGDTRTRANRATAYERLGRRAEAATDWKRVAAEAPGTALGTAAAGRARSLAD